MKRYCVTPEYRKFGKKPGATGPKNGWRKPNWADATEGSPSVWAREHYEWSDNRIVGTTQDSNVWEPGGTWTLTVHPHNGSGSRIHIDLNRRFKGKGWIFYPAVALFGRRMFERNLQKTLDVLARQAS